jgi:hypothetical protein
MSNEIRMTKSESSANRSRGISACAIRALSMLRHSTFLTGLVRMTLPAGEFRHLSFVI